MIRIARPGPRERLAPDHPLRHAELLADAPHLVLEEQPQRLDELHLHVGRQAADVVVALDRLGDAVGAAGLDHVASRASPGRASVTSPSLRASSSKTRMNSSPMRLRFSSGSVDAGEPREEALLRLHVDERHVEVAAERLDDLRGLVLAQQPVVDEDAGELVADRLVHEQRRDGAVDAAGEPAEHALAADLRADPLDLLLDHRRRRPRRATRRRCRRGSSSAPAWPCGVCTTSGWNWIAVEAARVVLERGDRRRRPSRRRRARPAGGATTESRCDIQTVCSAARSRKSSLSLDVQLGLAELAGAGAVDAAAELDAPSAACRSRCRASARRARRSPGRRAARRRRRPRPARRRGSARPGCAAAPPRRDARCETSSE